MEACDSTAAKRLWRILQKGKNGKSKNLREGDSGEAKIFCAPGLSSEETWQRKEECCGYPKHKKAPAGDGKEGE